MTITKRTLPNGNVELTMTQADKEYLQAYQYQERHHLSLTRAAIKARIKTWNRMRERAEQEGVDAKDWIVEI
jgi:hypothetical protein